MKVYMMKKIISSQIVRVVGALVVGAWLGAWLWGGAVPVHDHGMLADVGTVWTCSMHPQIRQSEPGQCPICGMDLIPMREKVTSDGSKSPFVHHMSAEAVAMAHIQTSPVTYLRPETQVFLSGKVAVNEQRLRVITAHYAGRIENLYVDFTGQNVQKGDKLATIYSPELMTAQQELLETAKNKLSNNILYQAARERLRLWKITEKQMDHIEETGEIVTEFDVFADVSGVVLKRTVTEGDHVSRGSALFEIADLREVWVLLDAYEDDLPWIKTGSQVDFEVASLPGKVFASKVTFIDPVINPQTRTASIRAVATNPDLALKLDLFVNAQIKSSVSNPVLVIPKSAVLWTGKRSVVYVDLSQKDTPAFEMREVVLGPRTGDWYVVEKGATEGTRVVTQGVFAIDAAAQLSGNYSMMNRPLDGGDGHQKNPSEKDVPSLLQGHRH
jgi:Cu(I)/Ag(I) efflux system membrane fusion protein